MSPKLFASLAASALAAAAASCTVSTPVPDQDETAFCEDWAKTICQVGSGQCNFDVTTCAAYQTNACTTFVQAQQGGTRQYNQPNGQACIKALNGAYGGNPTSISAATLAQVSSFCNKVVIANEDAGAPCTADNDCAEGLECAPYFQGGSLCESVTTRTLGQACADPGDQCSGDSYCSTTTTPPMCVPAPATGAACSATVPCGSNARCADGDMCEPLAGTGDPCSTDSDCASGYCDPYPPVQCTNGLSFARGSFDCQGIEGLNPAMTGTAASDAGAD